MFHFCDILTEFSQKFVKKFFLWQSNFFCENSILSQIFTNFTIINEKHEKNLGKNYEVHMTKIF